MGSHCYRAQRESRGAAWTLATALLLCGLQVDSSLVFCQQTFPSVTCLVAFFLVVMGFSAVWFQSCYQHSSHFLFFRQKWGYHKKADFKPGLSIFSPGICRRPLAGLILLSTTTGPNVDNKMGNLPTKADAASENLGSCLPVHIFLTFSYDRLENKHCLHPCQ